MEDELTCAICLDLFKDPVTLPCTHYFCRECTNQIAQSCMSFCCPTCREHVSKDQLLRLTENKCLSNIVAAYRREKEMASSVSEMICRSHQTERLFFFCETCQKPVCSECVTLSHNDANHEVSCVEHLIQDKKEHISELMNTLENFKGTSEKRKISLSRQKMKLMKEKEAAKKSCSLLIDLLKSQLTRMQSEYQKISDKIYVKCNEVDALNEASLTTIKYLKSSFTSLKYKADRHMHFQMLCAFEKQLSSFISSTKTTDPLRLDDMMVPKFVICNASALERAIKETDLESQSIDGGWETYFTKNEEVMNGNSSERQLHDLGMGNRDSSTKPGFQSTALSSVALSSPLASICGQFSRLRLLPSLSSIPASSKDPVKSSIQPGSVSTPEVAQLTGCLGKNLKPPLATSVTPSVNVTPSILLPPTSSSFIPSTGRSSTSLSSTGTILAVNGILPVSSCGAMSSTFSTLAGNSTVMLPFSRKSPILSISTLSSSSVASGALFSVPSLSTLAGTSANSSLSRSSSTVPFLASASSSTSGFFGELTNLVSSANSSAVSSSPVTSTMSSTAVIYSWNYGASEGVPSSVVSVSKSSYTCSQSSVAGSNTSCSFSQGELGSHPLTLFSSTAATDTENKSKSSPKRVLVKSSRKTTSSSSHHCFVPKIFSTTSATDAFAGIKQMLTTSATTSSNIVIASALSRELKKEPIFSRVPNGASEGVPESNTPVITSSLLADSSWPLPMDTLPAVGMRLFPTPTASSSANSGITTVSATLSTEGFQLLRPGTSISSSSTPFVPIPFPSTSFSSKDNTMESCQLSLSSWGMPATQSTSGASATNSEVSIVPASTGITLPVPVFTIGSSQDGTSPNTKPRFKKWGNFKRSCDRSFPDQQFS